MAWYDEAVFYHIYPLGLTGAPKQNEYGEPVHRLNTLLPWIEHIKRLGFTALYIGPLFESVGHGYETTDYKKLDSRLGTNEDLVAFVHACHEVGIKVVFDGVFNHTGRDFFAFADIREHREASPYRDWYCNVNFWGNNEYNDGFSYDNWGGYNLLAKLNQRNPAVRDYLCDVVRFWVSEFDIDGIRLDAADVLDFDFMRALRYTADTVKPEFWLMGEVIHGDYSRWANEQTLHSVTDYALHKGLYSGHNDHNYFEIAHTVRRTMGMVPAHIRLYNFVDNHDVERISTRLLNKAHYLPVHILLYTLPGIPSVYYGSEFGIEGKKERYSDDSLRPHIELADYEDAYDTNPCTKLCSALGAIHRKYLSDLAWGDYRELSLTTEQYSFARGKLVIALNNAEHEASLSVGVPETAYMGLLSGEELKAKDGKLNITLPACGGDIFAPKDYVPED
ncbi:MAG: alpha-amylase family glycosyl hydrolase, partial [Coriobacteriales bacterium]|nr:alpha-amylase family glycosyl hydrolase [Coriobacteriales bacterium]